MDNKGSRIRKLEEDVQTLGGAISQARTTLARGPSRAEFDGLLRVINNDKKAVTTLGRELRALAAPVNALRTPEAPSLTLGVRPGDVLALRTWAMGLPAGRPVTLTADGVDALREAISKAADIIADIERTPDLDDIRTLAERSICWLRNGERDEVVARVLKALDGAK
jgi:hypothetical protein